ncbi:D-amino-acid transaminase [Maricaulis sp. D1M11]|uniref:D-amino-acid transaminase n=1 Tax=Maricaulis sp. D1M11 TaxID=3076117 RepID=UPI0039B3BD32
MTRFAYVNGRFVPHQHASVHVEDRGYQFADAVYEVWSVSEGQLRDARGHFARLWRSLDALAIRHPLKEASLRLIIGELLRRNRVRDGLVYLQISRGVARRDHLFPHPDTPPSLVLTCKRVDPRKGDAVAETGISVISHPDQRWDRCDIKTVNLLPNVLAKQAGREAGAGEVWLTQPDGHVTEATSSNAWIVTAEGELVTHPATSDILGGITRASLIEIARERGIVVHERAFTLDEAKRAREAFVTSATRYVTPVTQIDGTVIGNGMPGSVALALRDAYLSRELR